MKVIMRQGVWRPEKNQGFGWSKIQWKHNIHRKGTVGVTLKNPNGGTPSGMQRKYTAIANLWACAKFRCRVVDSRDLITIVEFRYFKSFMKKKIKGPVGVKTTYCDNPDRAWKCPDWADDGVNGPPGRSAGQAQGTDTGVVYSYAPVSEQQLKRYNRVGSAPGLVGTR